MFTSRLGWPAKCMHCYVFVRFTLPLCDSF
uniref:Uncharacterized protein n=1 Tax=Anguilla anguilla TaxID=7936 RepID=A0A0E9PBV3_ANGAN